jgi:hypothetical protein
MSTREVISKQQILNDTYPDDRYPFVASEIFNCEITAVVDKFFSLPSTADPLEDEDEEKAKIDEEEDAEDESRMV